MIERVVHTQLYSYLSANNLLPPLQSGFRQFHSTETAVLKVYNDLVLAADKGYVTALILLDFSAAFDCVDHCILLKVLQDSFGMTGTILNWFLSYLSNRTQYVRINRLISSIASVLFGVPQGSVLGPLLFILYTSALSAIASRHGIEIHLYADDTQLYVHLRLNEVANATKRLRACIDNIMLWSLSMRLKLNPGKSELIWFDRSSKLLQCTELSLSTSSSLLSPASTVASWGHP
jgi:hypothetical protein